MVDTVDLNADLGERDNEAATVTDEPLIRQITSANIACGGHAGNEAVMRATILLALKHGVAIGAHPSFEDRSGFGRVPMALSAAAIEGMVARQIVRLVGQAEAEGTRIRHVKPHGALYNLAARDRPTADAIARAVASIDPSLALVGLARSELIRAADRTGLCAIPEVFADRRYAPDGMLVPRRERDAIIDSPDEAVQQAMRLLNEFPDDAGTICVHGDTPEAFAIARKLRLALEAQGVRLKSRS